MPDPGLDPPTVNHWENVRQFREIVTKGIEARREKKELGSSLQAELDIHVNGATYESLQRLGQDLKFVLITSRATVHRRDGGPLDVDVQTSPHAKCGRCWHHRADVGTQGICSRCETNLHGAGEQRRYA